MREKESALVIQACVKAENTNAPADRARATRLLTKYVEQRVNEGFEEKRVRAAIKAHVTRRLP